MQRKRKTRTKKRSIEKFPTTEPSETSTLEDLAYLDTLPEHMKLVEVTSNIWGTKFKIHGLAKSSLPANLGQVTYKTSLLHLQPRQMTLVITELRDDFQVGPDPNFNPNIFSEDEDEYNLKVRRLKRAKTFGANNKFFLSFRAQRHIIERKKYLITQTIIRDHRRVHRLLQCLLDPTDFHQYERDDHHLWQTHSRRLHRRQHQQHHQLHTATSTLPNLSDL